MIPTHEESKEKGIHDECGVGFADIAGEESGEPTEEEARVVEVQDVDRRHVAQDTSTHTPHGIGHT